MVSARSGLPRRWFSARAVSVNNAKGRGARGAHGRCGDRSVASIDSSAAGRRRRRCSPRSSSPTSPCRGRKPHRQLGQIGRRIAEAVLHIGRDRQIGGGDDAPRACVSASSRVNSPSRRPSTPAAAPLEVASASKPRPASSFAEPTSHGLGMTKARGPAWSSRRRRALSAVEVGMAGIVAARARRLPSASAVTRREPGHPARHAAAPQPVPRFPRFIPPRPAAILTAPGSALTFAR